MTKMGRHLGTRVLRYTQIDVLFVFLIFAESCTEHTKHMYNTQARQSIIIIRSVLYGATLLLTETLHTGTAVMTNNNALRTSTLSRRRKRWRRGRRRKRRREEKEKEAQKTQAKTKRKKKKKKKKEKKKRKKKKEVEVEEETEEAESEEKKKRERKRISFLRRYM